MAERKTERIDESGRGEGREAKSWLRLPRMGSRRQRSLDGAPSMLINSFARAVYRVHALIKREPAITIIPRICSDFLGRTSETTGANVDGWIGWMDEPTLSVKRSRKRRGGKEEEETIVRSRSSRSKKFLKGEGRNKWSS